MEADVTVGAFLLLAPMVQGLLFNEHGVALG